MSFISSLPASVIGVIMLAMFLTFYWLKIFPTTRAILAFVGFCLVAGGGGHITGAIEQGARWAAHLGGTATEWAAGISAGALIITIPVAIIFIHDLHPKNTAGKRTGWAGIALAALLVSGVSGISAANGIPSDIVHGVNNAKQIAK